MAKSALLDAVVDSRRLTIFHEEDGRNFIETKQDAEPILEFVSQARDRPQNPDFHHLGSVPETVFNQAVVEGWVHDPKAWRRYLNEHTGFRVGSRVL